MIVVVLSHTIFEQHTPLNVENARHQWSERRSLIVEVITQDGIVAQGEAAPLPGFSRETLDECRVVLEHFPWSNLGSYDPTQPLQAQLCRWLKQLDPRVPAARFAVESVLLDLWGKQKKMPAASLLTTHIPSTIMEIAALLPMDNSSKAAMHFASHGFTTFKLKVGKDLRTDLENLRNLRQVLGPCIRLRVDANQTWSITQAREFINRAAPYDIEFVEDPVPIQMLPDLGKTAVPLAIDEGLLDCQFEPSLLKTFGVEVFVLKPSLLGGYCIALDWAARARAAGIEVVISHLFEGPVGFAACVCLAQAIQSPRLAASLGPYANMMRLWDNDPAWIGLKCGKLPSATGSGLGVFRAKAATQ